MKHLLKLIAFKFLFAVALTAQAEVVRVAVASNFSAPMKSIASEFEKDTGHRIELIFGSSGKLYAQIVNGAPFQVFLSADSSKPARLEKEGRALTGSRFTYAQGTLVLWSARPGLIDDTDALLISGQFKRLAIANERLAPYGLAAREVLENIKVWAQVKDKLVMGENIAQTYQFVSTGNADVGFIALSQAIETGQLQSGSAWIVPPQLHAPIQQDAVLLDKGRDNPGAMALLDYLRSDKAVSLIRSHGYRL
jgi:molybdate transport system substrate-binding protein